MTRRPIALQLILLTAVVALIALSLAAPACAPSAPAGQGGTGDPVADNEATATATATLASTPALQAELSPLVNAVIVKQATIEASNGPGATPGQDDTTRPQTIDVSIYAVDEQRSDVEPFLADNGVPVRSKMKCGDECLILRADVPLSLLQALSAHPAVGLIDSIEKYYEQLDGNLNLIIAEYDAGLITEQEAVAQSLLPHWENRVLLTSDFDSPTNAQNARRYLEDNGVYLVPVPSDSTVVGGLIPFRMILPFSQQPGALIVYGVGYGADLTDPEVQEALEEYKPPQPASGVVTETFSSNAEPIARGPLPADVGMTGEYDHTP